MPNDHGFGLIEVIVTLGLVGIFLLTTTQLFPLTLKQIRTSEQDSRALFFAQDAIEAAKNVQSRSFEELRSLDPSTIYHPEIEQGEWRFKAGNEILAPVYTREVRFLEIRRDEQGGIVPEGGEVDPNIRKVEVTISWPGQGGTRNQTLSTYVADWDYADTTIRSFVQSEDNDFRHGSGQRVDLFRFPGSIRLNYQLLLSENFESFSPSSDPPDWYDTGANYNLNPNPDLFKTDLLDTMVFGTNANPPNIHTHYIGAGATDWTNYEVSGRMMTTDAAGKMGITFFAQYPSQDKYYFLGNVDSDRSFIISGRNHSITPQGVDDRDTEVIPLPSNWYRFRIQVRDVSDQTLIVAKVWEDGKVEPASWQVDCYDGNAGRSIKGTIGLWSDQGGDKFIDDIEVRDATKYESNGFYESMKFNAGEPSQFDRLQWFGDLPSQTSIRVKLRSADTASGLDSEPWQGPTNLSDSYDQHGFMEKINGAHASDSWIQYRIDFSTNDQNFTPSFDQFMMFYAPQP